MGNHKLLEIRQLFGARLLLEGTGVWKLKLFPIWVQNYLFLTYIVSCWISVGNWLFCGISPFRKKILYFYVHLGVYIYVCICVYDRGKTTLCEHNSFRKKEAASSSPKFCCLLPYYHVIFYIWLISFKLLIKVHFFWKYVSETSFHFSSYC